MLNFFILNNYFYMYIKNNFNFITFNSFVFTKKLLKNINNLYINFFEKLLLEYSLKNTMRALANTNYNSLVVSIQLLALLILY